MAPPTVRKFTFDVRFDEPDPSERQPVLADLLVSEAPPPPIPDPEPPVPEEPPPVVFSEEELEFAREEAYVAGHATALQEAAASTERFIADALTHCAESISELSGNTEPIADAATATAIQVVHEICRKLLPHTADDYAIREIVALVRSLLPELSGQLRILVHANPHMVDVLRKRLAETIAKTGFEGRITLVGDPDLLPADTRVEWADGGAERSMTRVLDEIDALVERNIPLFKRGESLVPGHVTLKTPPQEIEDIWPDIDPKNWYTPTNSLMPDAGSASLNSGPEEMATSPLAEKAAPMDSDSGTETAAPASSDEDMAPQTESPASGTDPGPSA